MGRSTVRTETLQPEVRAAILYHCFNSVSELHRRCFMGLLSLQALTSALRGYPASPDTVTVIFCVCQRLANERPRLHEQFTPGLDHVYHLGPDGTPQRVPLDWAPGGGKDGGV